MPSPETDTIEQEPAESSLDAIREAQREWAAMPVGRRLEHIYVLRNLIVERSRDLAKVTAEARQVSEAETLTTEIIPLADALHFLETDAEEILKPRKLGKKGRPVWLKGVTAQVEHAPLGVILVIAPSNYPLFLAAVQSIQALVAGNAVVIKPAPGCSKVMELWDELFHEAGIPELLHHVLLEDPQYALDAIEAGIDKVVLTGGDRAGQSVLAACARAVTPSVVELSGIDAMYVRHDADMRLVVKALKFGLSANKGATCIAPRRIFVHHQRIAEFKERLEELELAGEPIKVPGSTALLISTTLDSGAMPLCGEWNESESSLKYPLILDGVPRNSPFWTQDLFGPIAVVQSVAGDQEALNMDRRCPYGLGASVFSNDLKGAQTLANEIPAPIVTINDVVAPTADPRLPFGGCKHSGFGVTRGAEGLLEMTSPKVVTSRRPKGWMPHLTQEFGENSAELFHQLLRLSHGAGMLARLKALPKVIKYSRTTKK